MKSCELFVDALYKNGFRLDNPSSEYIQSSKLYSHFIPNYHKIEDLDNFHELAVRFGADEEIMAVVPYANEFFRSLEEQYGKVRVLQTPDFIKYTIPKANKEKFSSEGLLDDLIVKLSGSDLRYLRDKGSYAYIFESTNIPEILIKPSIHF